MNENKVNLPQNHKSFREKAGESLLNNKVSILGAILFVLFLAEIKFLLPDLGWFTNQLTD